MPFPHSGMVHQLRFKRRQNIMWRTAGAQQILQLIVIAPLAYRPRQGSQLLYRDPAYLICTDPELDARQIIEAYFQRWDIEVNFRDQKTLLGVGQAQVRAPASVQSAPALAVAAYAMLLVSAQRAFGHSQHGLLPQLAVALCGVDNALARMSLEDAGFSLVIETGLGSGTQGFRNFSLHAFPSSLNARKIWTGALGEANSTMSDLPAYNSAKLSGLDRCGIVQLASRTIGIPFVGVTAACRAISEVLRRAHGGPALELVSGSVAALEDVETVSAVSVGYAFGHLDVA